LLEHGAVADVRYDEKGLISHDASYRGRAEVIELLLRHNADVNARGPDDRTPLYWASKYGQVEVAQLLLERGAHVNARGRNNWTPFEAATFTDLREIAVGAWWGRDLAGCGKCDYSYTVLYAPFGMP